jgi:hypothetical protein
MGPLLGRFVGLVVPVQRLFSALTSLVGPVQDIFSSLYTISTPLSPSPSKLGRQPCWVSCLVVCVSGLDQLNHLSNETLFWLNLLIHELLIRINPLLNCTPSL